MAGHSQFKNIMHRKGAQDAKRAKVFTKILREITVSARQGGPDPECNPRLRTVLTVARQANMPKENIERAIKKATEGSEADQYESLRYEGYGPEGIAILVEVLTDNRNRTAPEMRMIFNKNGGRMADANSVSFLFQHLGCILYTKECDTDALMLQAIEGGALDVQFDENNCSIFCPKEGLFALKDFLEADFGPCLEAQLIWQPHDFIDVQDEEALLKLIDALHDHDDVQYVFSNAKLSHRD